ncbi:MAG TPA: peptidoglycan DD-metalloendopeptidase family protein [Solirubrobacteraceae bacterium]|nr:peptidoglycan DD-metalloendopeptidase family protein [Solirubrobacteraceae bacterium]
MPARRLAILLLTVAFPLLLWAASPFESEGASPSAKLDRLQRQIQATEGRIGRKKGTERVLTTQIAAFTGRINRLEARIGGLQRRQSAVEADLSASRTRLEATQVELRAERARLVRLRARLAEVRAGLATRLRELYTAEQPDIVTVILEAKGFADLLERGDFLRRVSEQDQKIFRIVAAAKADATRSEKRLSALQRRQLALTQRIQARRDEVARIKQGVVSTRAGVAQTRAAKYRALRSARSERHHLEDELGTLRAASARIAAQLQRAQAAPGLGPVRQGSGALIWPVNGPITSPFCESRAWESCHPGIDIGVPAGTPIRAAAAGRVVLMQPESASGGYGNFTCVQHTASMSTCYAHQSRFATSTGARVGQGQVIGYVGCTGRCFGDHLHFEVRINGSVVNPMAYL